MKDIALYTKEPIVNTAGGRGELVWTDLLILKSILCMIVGGRLIS